MTVTFSHKEELAPNIYSFYFEGSTNIKYTSGQFIELHLPHPNPDDRGVKRWFTLSSSPTEKLLSITTKFSKESSTFKQALLDLTKNEKVHMASPMGDFVLPKDTAIPLVFVAGGIGITPVRSMIKYLYDEQELRTIKIYYSAHDVEQMVFLQLLNSYPLKLTTLINKTVTAQSLIKDSGLTNDAVYYISGPEPMVEKLVKQFDEVGNNHLLVTDYFPGYKAV